MLGGDPINGLSQAKVFSVKRCQCGRRERAHVALDRLTECFLFGAQLFGDALEPEETLLRPAKDSHAGGGRGDSQTSDDG
ncbi:hypothetical protein D3C76_1355850 [compost metagenome]